MFLFGKSYRRHLQTVGYFTDSDTIMTYFLLLAKGGRQTNPQHEFIFAKINIQKRY